MNPVWLLRLLLIAGGVGGYLTYQQRRHILANWLQIPPPENAVDAHRGLDIPMRDGVTLKADHYAPRLDKACPVIVIRTPYGRNGRGSAFGALLAFMAERFAERGYHVLVQDVRGCFDAEGAFNPIYHERDDGLDTIAWLREQTWFNGVVGTWGASYLGYTQWAISEGAPEVQAMMPIFTASRMQTVLFHDNALDLGLALRWMTVLDRLQLYRGKSLLETASLPFEVTQQAEKALMHLPLATADEAATGHPVSYYRYWLANADPNSEAWRRADALREPHAVTARVHLIAGWRDLFLRGQLDDYRRLRNANQRPRLTVGPWQHFSDANGLITGLREGLRWFDAHLKGRESERDDPPVCLYVMGAEEWRTYDDWPPPSLPQPYYLSEPDHLTINDPQSGSQTYVYDPRDPTPALGGAQFAFDFEIKDNRSHEARSDVLIFTTQALDEAVEVIGAVSCTLYVQSSSEHTDFFARLCDVQPDGRSLNVCDGLYRLTPERGERLPEGVIRVTVDLSATAYRFNVGHRIRLQIASGAHPRWARNLGHGDDPAKATALRSARQTIHYGERFPSALVLPV